VLVGAPVEVADLMDAASAQAWPPERLYAALASRVGGALQALQAQLEGREELGARAGDVAEDAGLAAGGWDLFPVRGGVGPAEVGVPAPAATWGELLLAKLLSERRGRSGAAARHDLGMAGGELAGGAGPHCGQPSAGEAVGARSARARVLAYACERAAVMAAMLSGAHSGRPSAAAHATAGCSVWLAPGTTTALA
jgi:hypothetical protein